MNTQAADPQSKDDRRLLSIQEVADWLDVSVETVRFWRANRSGPRGIRVGRHIRYRPSDVELWLELRSDPPPRRPSQPKASP
jgi:excisionase family DNA binding protein